MFKHKYRIRIAQFLILLLIIYVPFIVIAKLNLDNLVEIERSNAEMTYYRSFNQLGVQIDKDITMMLSAIEEVALHAGVRRSVEIFETVSDENKANMIAFFEKKTSDLKAKAPWVKDAQFVSAQMDVILHAQNDISQKSQEDLYKQLAQRPPSEAVEDLQSVLSRDGKILLYRLPGVIDEGVYGYFFVVLDSAMFLDTLQAQDHTAYALTQNQQLVASTALLPVWANQVAIDESQLTWSMPLALEGWHFVSVVDWSELVHNVEDNLYGSYWYYVIVSLVSVTLLSLSFYLSMEHARQNQLKTAQLDLTEQHNQKLRIYRHDLMNHLQVVSGLIEMADYEKSLEYIRGLSHEASFSKAKYELGVPEVEMLLFSYMPKAKKLGIEYDLNLTPIENMPYDVIKINTVLNNLIKNAFEALETVESHEKTVVVTMGQVGNFIRIDVTNNLPILKKEAQESLFEEGVSQKGQGRGLGLYITKGLVDEMGGTLALHVDRLGNHFVVILPYHGV